MKRQLVEKYRDQIKTDVELQGKIAKACGRSIQAPLRWANKNSRNLLLHDCIVAIREHNNISADQEIIETVNA